VLSPATSEMSEMKPVKSWFEQLLSRDRRRGERHEAPPVVAYYWDGAAPVAHPIRDISSAGFYLLTEQRWYVGTMITMTLQKTGGANTGSEASIAVQARVVRLGADGVGLAFVLQPPRQGRRSQGPLANGADRKTLDRFLRPLFAEGVIGPGGEEAQEFQVRESEPQEEAMKILSDERGQATIFTLLSMTVLLGLVGFAADVGILFHAKRNLQIAADSAAIAGAAELGYADLTTSAAGQAAATQNGFTNGVSGAVVAIHNPPLYGVHAGNPAFVEAIVSQNQQTVFAATFAALFHGTPLSTMTVAARAVATNGAGQGCVYTLGTSGADFSANGNASISVPTCGINDNSDSNNAMDLTGNVSVTAQSIAVVGQVSKTGNVTVSPTPVQGAVPSSNPLAYLTPPTYSNGSCTNANIQSGNNTTQLGPASPGGIVCYNGISASGTQVIDLSPGTYVINGGLGLSGNVTFSGTGVTLYLLDSASVTGNVALNLTAPGPGATYAGILFYQPPSNDTISLTGNSGSTLEGVIYAPGSAVTFNGNSGATIYTDFVVGSLSLVGNASFQSYAALPGGANPITAAKLVE
jgi:Flp pilus assembly protein TadG